MIRWERAVEVARATLVGSDGCSHCWRAALRTAPMSYLEFVAAVPIAGLTLYFGIGFVLSVAVSPFVVHFAGRCERFYAQATVVADLFLLLL